MHCPCCNQDLQTTSYEHISIFTCPKCQGIWLDESQLNTIVVKRENQFPLKEITTAIDKSEAGIPDAEVSKKLQCPECSQQMRSTNYNYSSGIILNVCPQGDGLWFDKDELKKLEMFMEYWEDKEAENKQNYLNMLKQTFNEQQAKINEENSKKSAIQRLLDSIYDFFDTPAK